MIVIISPAKTLDFVSKIPSFGSSEIIFEKEVLELIQNCQKLSKNEIADLMNISPKLAELNYNRFQNFNSSSAASRPALYAYNGDVYEGFNREEYTQGHINFAQKHLRIISGLYGLLRPLDNIKEYRLEMSIKLKNNHGDNLYKFWQEKVTNRLNKDLSESGSSLLINLASNEYSEVIDRNKFKGEIININFKEERNGALKTIAINSKKARGVMANFIIKKHINELDGVREFTELGYHYNVGLSDENNYFFIKKEN